jgi:hypothetical protein
LPIQKIGSATRTPPERACYRDGRAQTDFGDDDSGIGGRNRGFRAGFAWRLSRPWAWPQTRRSAAGQPIRSAIPDIEPARNGNRPVANASSATARQRTCGFGEARSRRHRARSQDQEHLPRLLRIGLARSERFELPTLGFEVRCSIQLSYERVRGFDYQTWPNRATQRRRCPRAYQTHIALRRPDGAASGVEQDQMRRGDRTRSPLFLTSFFPSGFPSTKKI